MPRPRDSAPPGSSPRRTSTTCSTASVEVDLLPAAERLGLGFLPYFPLANGLFTGKFTRTERPADTRIARQRPHVAEDAPWDAIEAYEAFCAERGISMLEATFGWLLAQPGAVERDRRGDEARAGRAERGGGIRLEPSPAEAEAIEGLFPLS